MVRRRVDIASVSKEVPLASSYTYPIYYYSDRFLAPACGSVAKVEFRNRSEFHLWKPTRRAAQKSAGPDDEAYDPAEPAIQAIPDKTICSYNVCFPAYLSPANIC
jgi:hypothetical protein